jgi:uncharacterized membrane protein YczE
LLLKKILDDIISLLDESWEIMISVQAILAIVLIISLILYMYVYFRDDLKRMPVLLLGYVFLAIGIMLTKRSTLGMAPWGVFHQGLMVQTGLSFGVITQLVGLVILLLSVVLLKTKIGIGTIFNVLIVGFLIDAFDEVYQYQPQLLLSKSIVLVFGVIIMTFGRSLYISAKLGSGPRDGVFVGLSRITNFDVKYVKPAIEFTVLIVGYLMGGTFGAGTVITVIVSGYLVQMWFKLLHFNPKEEVQHNLMLYKQK